MNSKRLYQVMLFTLTAATMLLIFCFMYSEPQQRLPLHRNTSTSETNLTKSMPLQHCAKKKNIVFLKTHKTASTTVQNILFRYGLRNRLKFAIPLNLHHFNYPQYFKRGSVTQIGTKQYNIICHHMRFNYEEVQHYMPPDSLYFTILREPGRLFESTFDCFYHLVGSFHAVSHHGEHSAEDWLDNATAYVRQYPHGQYAHFARNHFMFDFGFNSDNNSVAYINASIAKINEIFDFVMIADHFTESVILLADLLCWDLEDISCLNLNGRNHEADPISDEAHARISQKARQWNKADSAMFDFFNATLWKKIEKYGRARMKRDVQRLTEINANTMSQCVEGGTAVDYKLLKDRQYQQNVYKPKDVNMNAYNLKKEAKQSTFCNQLIAAENDFSHKVYLYQKWPGRQSAAAKGRNKTSEADQETAVKTYT